MTTTNPQTTLDTIASEFNATVTNRDSIRIPCPAHGGDDPNLAVWLTNDRINVKCHSHDCNSKDIYESIEARTGQPVNPPPHKPTQATSGPPNEKWATATYTQADGKHATEFRRNYPTDFPSGPCPYTPSNTTNPCNRTDPHKHTWTSKGAKQKDTLANLYQPLDPQHAPDLIILCEGVKAAHAARDAGYWTASVLGGANAGAKADYQPLLATGYPIAIWPDNDGPGWTFAHAAANKLAQQQPGVTIKLVKPNGATNSGDDAADLNPAQRVSAINAATPYQKPSAAQAKHPWPILNLDDRNGYHLAIRFCIDHASDIVIATDNDTAAIYYAHPDTGLLDPARGYTGAMLNETLNILGDEAATTLDPKAQSQYFRWLNDQNSERGANRLRENITAAIIRMQQNPNLTPLMPTICKPDDLNHDPTIWGCSNGALDIHTLTILPAADARAKLITATTGVTYDPNTPPHPAVDTIMPATPSDYADYIGWALTHAPMRDCGAEIAGPGTGKTTRRLAIQAGMGKQYVTSTRVNTFVTNRFGDGASSYNDGLFQLAPPAKICFVPEITSGLDIRLINQATGETTIPVRGIREKETIIRVAGHLMFQGNNTGDGETLLGLASVTAGDEAEAFAERLRLFDIPDIPPERKDPTLRNATQTPEFAAAMLVRLAEHAHRMLNSGPDAPVSDTMRQRLAEQQRAEQPTWITECLEQETMPEPSDANETVTTDTDHWVALDSWHATRMVQRWFKDYGDPKAAPSATAVYKALVKLYGPPYPTKQKIDKRLTEGGRVNAWLWPDHIINPNV